MTIKALPGLTLITLSLFSGFTFADAGNSCEAAIQQLMKQQNETTNQLNTRLSILLDQQGHTTKQLAKIEDLQQQAGKQSATTTPQATPAKKAVKKDNVDACVAAEPGKTTPDGKMILGETEWMYVEEANGTFLGRIDTGATTSSISAQNVTVFEREGRRWVRFDIPVNNEKKVTVEAPFVKYDRFRQANGLEDRPIVKMTIRMGSVTEKAEFSLTDRSTMDFPVLVGREFFKDIGVVDVARENVQGKPQVPGAFIAAEQYSASQKKGKSDKLLPVKQLYKVENDSKPADEPKKETAKPADAPKKEATKPAKKEVKAAATADAPVKQDSAVEVKPLVKINEEKAQPTKTATPADVTPVKKPDVADASDKATPAKSDKNEEEANDSQTK